MLTIRAATSLLAQASSLDALGPLVRKLGFETPLADVSLAARATLGVAEWASEARMGVSQGNLRLIAVRLAGDSAHDARELTRRIAAALVRNAPARLWCVASIDASGGLLCLASVSAHPDGPRVAALRVDRNRIVDSDADTVRALASIPADDDRIVHARWTDILKRDALSARFYRTLEALVRELAITAKGKATSEERGELALLCASRLLFLAFLEAKGWLAGERGFLLTQCTNQLERGGRLHERFLRPLFFGTLNTPAAQRATASLAFGAVPFLNGGLFSPTRLEQQRRTLTFSDDAITAIIGNLLDRFRFTAREDSSTWSESAVDPEMLGRAFECLMATDERRKSGSFYTPPSLVEVAVNDALHAAIPGLHDGPLPPALVTKLESLRILDPACGSGAFLVHMLEHISALLHKAGDDRPVHVVRREVLTRSIFGVDRNPMAVWLCELRLWLSVVIECPETRASRIPPLPNLDHHIRVGDTLSAGNLQFASESARTLTSLRQRYAQATGSRKRTLALALDNDERKRAVSEVTRMIDATTNARRDLLHSVRQRDLFGERSALSRAERVRLVTLRATLREQRIRCNRLTMGGALPFRFAAHFADVAATGFDIVIGNPPWVRPHNLPAAERLRLRGEYQTLRDAAWRTGATRAGAGVGFAAQADLAVAFVERGTQLLKPSGVLALLLPAKIWRSLAGGGVRRFLAEHMHLHTVRDWSDANGLFDAAVYPSLLVATRGRTNKCVHISVTRHSGEHVFDIEPHLVSMAGDTGAPWVLLPPSVREAFEHLRRAGPALGDSTLGRPLLGVKCGLNSAFLVHATEHDDDTATILDEGRKFLVERSLLRPALRGDAIPVAGVRGRSGSAPDLRILWTHATDGAPLRILPPRTARWFARYRSQLETRKDARSTRPWWTLFRTEAARFESTRLVWADLGRSLRTTILPAGDPTVPLNTCYVLRTASFEDACALNTLLTSPVAAAWLDAIAEPARGGWRRYLGWTVAALPVPENWDTARALLAKFWQLQQAGAQPTPEQHIAVVAAAYGIPLQTLLPLLHWHSP
ncbi:MAG: N-6 DNA methylase [Phycisphaerae bacterium]|nr:N-6 DNA methylase [Gemmatimonadaceae bacterium]